MGNHSLQLGHIVTLEDAVHGMVVHFACPTDTMCHHPRPAPSMSASRLPL